MTKRFLSYVSTHLAIGVKLLESVDHALKVCEYIYEALYTWKSKQMDLYYCAIQKLSQTTREASLTLQSEVVWFLLPQLAWNKVQE